jgi:anti-sigma-K factor RskA
MLTVAPDRLAAALGELDPEARALLDLSIRRGIRDEDLAELLKTEPSEVARRRDDAIERVAAGVGSTARPPVPEVRTALAELPPESLGERPPARVAGPLSLRRVLFPIVAVGAVVAGLVIAGAYHGEDSGPAAPASNPGAPEAPLTALGRGPEHGTARISGDRLDLSVTGLPQNASYQVWAYDSISDAVSLGSFRGPSARVHPPFPKDAGRHRYLDVSLEPRDGNPNHSGQSVLRAPLAKLR